MSLWPQPKDEIEAIWFRGYWFGMEWGFVFGFLFGLIFALAVSPFVLWWFLNLGH